MATAPTWFDHNLYMNNKLAQVKATDPAGNWTMDMVVKAFAGAGFGGDTAEAMAEGAYRHFTTYGSKEDVSPNALFNATEYYEAKAASFFKKTADPTTVTAAEVAYVKNAIAEAGMDAWTHYNQYGTTEDVNPSNSFNTKAYLDAKAAALNTKLADGEKPWTAETVAAAFKAAGMSALEHFYTYGSTGGEREIAKADFEAQVKSPDSGPFKVPAEQKVNPGGGSGSGGETAMLTTGIDVMTGNLFDAPSMVSMIGAQIDTLQSTDSLTGTGTNPTLNVTLAAANVAYPTLTGIETINIQAQGADPRVLNLSKATGVQNVNLDISQQSLTVQALNANAAITVQGSVPTTDAFVTFADSVVSGSEDVAKVTLTNNGVATVTGQQAINLRGVTAGGFETIEITAVGTNRIAEILSDSAADLGEPATASNSVRTIKVSGEGSLRVDTALLSTTTFDASANKGGVNVTLDNTGDVTATGGEGDDTFNMADTLTNTDKIDGGDGRDTLRVSSTTGLGVGNKITNTEILRFDAATTFTFDNDDITSIDTIVHNTTGTMTYSDMAVASASDATKGLTILNSGDVTYSLKGVGSLGATDQGLYIKVGGTNADDAAALQTVGTGTGDITGDITTDGSSLTLDVQAFNGQTATGTGAITANSITSLTIKGGAAGEAFEVGTVGNTGNLLASIDGSGFVGDLTVAGTSIGQVIKGGSGDDVLSTGGRDVATANGDVLTGGEGNDTFTFNASDSTAALPNAALATFNAAQKALFTQITDLNLGGTATATAIDNVDLSDVLDFTGTVGIANGGAVTAMTGKTFGEAVNELVAGILKAGSSAGDEANAGLFTWAGETFLIVNEAADSADTYATGDTLVILVTGVTGTLDASDFTTA